MTRTLVAVVLLLVVAGWAQEPAKKAGLKKGSTVVVVSDGVKVTGDAGVKIPNSFTIANDDEHPVVTRAKPDEFPSWGWLNSETGAGWASAFLTMGWAVATFFFVQWQDGKQKAFQAEVVSWQQAQATTQAKFERDFADWQKSQAEVELFDKLRVRIMEADNQWTGIYVTEFHSLQTQYSQYGKDFAKRRVIDELESMRRTYGDALFTELDYFYHLEDTGKIKDPKLLSHIQNKIHVWRRDFRDHFDELGQDDERFASLMVHFGLRPDEATRKAMNPDSPPAGGANRGA